MISYIDNREKQPNLACPQSTIYKLFVFLSRIDSLATPEALKTHIEEASQDWFKRAKLPQERIISGSAGAYLLLNGLAGEQTRLEIGEAIACANYLLH